MNKRICDICKINEAERSFKAKRSKRGMWVSNRNTSRYDGSLWSFYEKIDVCNSCITKLIDNRNK